MQILLSGFQLLYDDTSGIVSVIFSGGWRSLAVIGHSTPSFGLRASHDSDTPTLLSNSRQSATYQMLKDGGLGA